MKFWNTTKGAEELCTVTVVLCMREFKRKAALTLNGYCGNWCSIKYSKVRGVCPRAGLGEQSPTFFKVGGLREWSFQMHFQLISCAWIVSVKCGGLKLNSPKLSLAVSWMLTA